MSENTRFAPHWRRIEHSSFLCWDALVLLVPLTVYSCVYYGFRPLYVMLVGVISAMAFEVLGYALRMQRAPLYDGTAAVTGGVIALVMSPIAPYWAVMAATAFAILFVKLPFGGRGHNLFNPAAGGLAFATVCFPAAVFTYPDPLLPISGVETIITKTSPAAVLQAGGTPAYSGMDIVLSNIPGPIGSVPIILAACILYLFVRRASSPWVVLPFLGTCAAIAALFPRADGGALQSIVLELFSGYLMLAATFLIADPVTAPRHWLARICYGVLGGVLLMLLRHIGRYEEGACFAVLLANLFAGAFDRWCWRLCYTLRRRAQERKGGAAA